MQISFDSSEWFTYTLKVIQKCWILTLAIFIQFTTGALAQEPCSEAGLVSLRLRRHDTVKNEYVDVDNVDYCFLLRSNTMFQNTKYSKEEIINILKSIQTARLKFEKVTNRKLPKLSIVLTEGEPPITYNKANPPALISIGISTKKKISNLDENPFCHELGHVLLLSKEFQGDGNDQLKNAIYIQESLPDMLAASVSQNDMDYEIGRGKGWKKLKYTSSGKKFTNLKRLNDYKSMLKDFYPDKYATDKNVLKKTIINMQSDQIPQGKLNEKQFDYLSEHLIGIPIFNLFIKFCKTDHCKKEWFNKFAKQFTQYNGAIESVRITCKALKYPALTYSYDIELNFNRIFAAFQNAFEVDEKQWKAYLEKNNFKILKEIEINEAINQDITEKFFTDVKKNSDAMQFLDLYRKSPNSPGAQYSCAKSQSNIGAKESELNSTSSKIDDGHIKNSDESIKTESRQNKSTENNIVK